MKVAKIVVGAALVMSGVGLWAQTTPVNDRLGCDPCEDRDTREAEV